MISRDEYIQSMTKWEQDKFWSKVEKSALGCWKWLGSHNQYGYGQFYIERQSVQAHRVSFFLHYGYVPRVDDGRMVCHTCDNPGCLRPDHLYDGDNSSNQKDRWGLDITPEEVDEVYNLYLYELLSMRKIAEKVRFSESVVVTIIKGRHELSYLGDISRSRSDAARIKWSK